MAISKILHMKQARSGYMAKHLANGLKYIMNPDKTENGRYISGSNCLTDNVLQQMLDTKRHFGKMDKRQRYHLIISFEEGEVSEDTAFEIVGHFVKEYLGPDFEAVYAIHNDTEHIHGHIIFNSVRCTTGYKYNYKNGEWDQNIQPLVNRLCSEHGLSTLNMDKVQEKRHRRRMGEQKEPDDKSRRISDRDTRIMHDVDTAVKDAETYEEFLEVLEIMGYEIHGKKHLAVQEPGARRARRLEQLGEEYTEEMLRCRIEQPPVPSVTSDGRGSELVYIFIPYRQRHLTRYQKECFVRKYRAGKTRTDTKTWKYRANLRAIKQLEEEYLFLAEHQIHTKEQFDEIILQVDKEIAVLCEERKLKEKKNKPYQTLMNLLEKIDEAAIEAGLYLKGYPEFREEYVQYKHLVDKLRGLGYSIADMRTIACQIELEKRMLENRRKELLKEKRIALKLKEDIRQKQQVKKIEAVKCWFREGR